MRPTILAFLVLLVVGSLAGCGEGEVEGTRGPGTPDTAAADAEVTLSDVTYACGPTDATGVQFTVVATRPVRGIAELLVGDEVFGATEELTFGSEPVDVWMDISLDQEAYDAGAGEVRFRAIGTDVALASEAVVLRLPIGGGCG